MRAVILVGGFGTRLRPLTLSTPKQMLPVAHRPMIEHVVEHLGRHGVETAVLALGYRPDAFVEAYPDGEHAGVRLEYAVEPEPLDTAGAIRFAARHGGIQERFLVVNGDVLTDLDVTALVTFHDNAGAEGTIALTRVEDPSGFGVVPTDEDGKVLAFIEKPPRDEAPTDLVNAGTYVLEPSVLDRIPADERVNVERVTFPAMASEGTLYARDGDSYWIDAGTPASYLRANLDLTAGPRADLAPCVHDSARVDGSADSSVVGPGAVIKPGATVIGSVVLSGATVRRGARVESSVIGPRATVGVEARVRGLSVIGDDVEVAPRAVVDGERVPEV